MLSALQIIHGHNNNLRWIPASFARLKNLKHVDFSENPLVEEFDNTTSMDAPSALENCARWFVRKNLYYENEEIPMSIKSYLGSAKICDCCFGPYFQAFVVRGRMWQFNEERIPL
eukprot:Pgem_evm1s16216